MNITIKNVKHVEFASDETHCFSASVYVDGKRSFGVSNNGHGGADAYHSIDKKTHSEVNDIVASIDAELGKETIKTDFGDLTNDLELVIGELVNDWVVDRLIKKNLKKICYVKGGSVYLLPAKHKPTTDNIAAVQKAPWWKPENKILNGLPLAEVRQYFN